MSREWAKVAESKKSIRRAGDVLRTGTGTAAHSSFLTLLTGALVQRLIGACGRSRVGYVPWVKKQL
jgi:hypothetical protein